MNECDTDAWDGDISKPTVLTCVRFASDVIVQGVITQSQNAIAAFTHDILFRRINFVTDRRFQDTIQPSNWHQRMELQFHNSIWTKIESDQNMVIEMCQYYYPHYTRTCAERYVYHCVCRFRTQKMLLLLVLTEYRYASHSNYDNKNLQRNKKTLCHRDHRGRINIP